MFYGTVAHSCGVARGGGNSKLVMIQSCHRFGLAASSPNLSEGRVGSGPRLQNKKNNNNIQEDEINMPPHINPKTPPGDSTTFDFSNSAVARKGEGTLSSWDSIKPRVWSRRFVAKFV